MRNDRKRGVDLRVVPAEIAQQKSGTVTTEGGGVGGEAKVFGGKGAGRERRDQTGSMPSATACS